MTFTATFERAALRIAVKFIAGNIIERRNSIPILSGLRIVPVEGGAELTGTDLDIEAQAFVPCDAVTGSIVIADAHAFAAALDAYAGTIVEIASNDDPTKIGGASLACGGSSSTLATLPVGDFPNMKADAALMPVEYPVEAFAHDIARVRVAISTEETRYYLNGIHIGKHGDNLKLAATDGHRMAVVSRPLPEGLDEFKGAIIPRKVIAVAAKLFGKKPTGAFSLAIGKTHGAIAFAGVTLAFKLIDGTFPDFHRVIPAFVADGQTNAARFDPAALRASALSVTKGSGKKDGAALKMTFEPGACALSHENDGQIAAGSLACAYSGIPGAVTFDIGINAKYLADIMATFGHDVRLQMADANSPIRIGCDGEPDHVAVIMPLRVGAAVAKAKSAAAETQKPIAAVAAETPRDVFERAYSEALTASDWNALREALAVYRAHLVASGIDAARIPWQIRLVTLMARQNLCHREANSVEFNAIRKRIRYVARCDQAALPPLSYRSFSSPHSRPLARLARVIADMKEKADWLASIDMPEDAPDVVRVRLRSGKLAYTFASDIREGRGSMPLLDANGCQKTRRRSGLYLYRGDIASLAIKRAVRAKAPVIDEAPQTVASATEAVLPTPEAPEAEIEPSAPLPAPIVPAAPIPDTSGLAARVEALESALAKLNAPRSVTIAAPANDTKAAEKRTPAHARSIQRAWDMRKAMRERADLDGRALLVSADAIRKVEARHAEEVERLRSTIAASDRAFSSRKADIRQLEARAERLARVAVSQRRNAGAAVADRDRAKADSFILRAQVRQLETKLAALRAAIDASPIVARTVNARLQVAA